MKKIPNIREEVYRCGNTKILYLPYCDTSGWGPDVRKMNEGLNRLLEN
jgi:hypothetical protein